MSRAQVKAGEDVLIWGISGGVALAALIVFSLLALVRVVLHFAQ